MCCVICIFSKVQNSEITGKSRVHLYYACKNTGMLNEQNFG